MDQYCKDYKIYTEQYLNHNPGSNKRNSQHAAFLYDKSATIPMTEQGSREFEIRAEAWSFFSVSSLSKSSNCFFFFMVNCVKLN